MPNPLIRLGAPNQSKEATAVDAPPPHVEPVPERVRGVNHAYRGMEDHGVPSTLEYRDPEEYDAYDRGVAVDYEPVEEQQEPIPVYIVNTQEQGRQFIKGLVFRAYATGSTKGTNATNVVSADYQGRRRVKVKVKNLDTTVVYVAFTAENANPMSGWPLAANEVFEHVGEDDIWATGTSPADSPLAVSVEYVVVLGGHAD